MLSSIILTLSALAAGAFAHRTHIDDGTHLSIATAWEFPDPLVTRALLISFDCPSVASYSMVMLNESTSIAIGVGIPNITALHDYKPSLWAIGKNVVTPEGYQTDSDRQSTGIPEDTTFQPNIPRGFNAVEYPSAGNGVFVGFSEGDDGVAGYGILSANVTVSGPGEVYFALQPKDNRKGRAFISMGVNEDHNDEPGSTNELDRNGWFKDGVTPGVGNKCIPWSA